jgi:hypothetical protein
LAATEFKTALTHGTPASPGGGVSWMEWLKLRRGTRPDKMWTLAKNAGLLIAKKKEGLLNTEKCGFYMFLSSNFSRPFVDMTH